MPEFPKLEAKSSDGLPRHDKEIIAPPAERETIAGLEFKARVIMPDCRIEDFPGGFGLELSLSEGGSSRHFEDILAAGSQRLIQLTRQYGAVILQGLDIKKSSKNDFPFRPTSNKRSTLESWHFDRNEVDTRKMSLLVLTQDASNVPRPIPTLIAPTPLIARHIKTEMRDILIKEALTEEIATYYKKCLIMPAQELLDSINTGFESLRNSKAIRNNLMSLLRRVEKKQKSSILSHLWSKNKGSILLILTEEERSPEGRPTCKVMHARISDPKEITKPNNPLNKEYYLERGFIYDV